MCWNAFLGVALKGLFSSITHTAVVAARIFSFLFLAAVCFFCALHILIDYWKLIQTFEPVGKLLDAHA
jgi:hypothetical protein